MLPSEAGPQATTVLTLSLDAESQARFQTLRQQYFPPTLNRIPAHLTLFHQLPAGDSVHKILLAAATACAPFDVAVTGLRSLGSGVAYTLAAPELSSLHARLSAECATFLIPQDRQRFAPHVVVQNKVTSQQMRETLAGLQQTFEPWTVQATGLDWWDYLGGPWQLRERFRFGYTARVSTAPG